MFSTENKIKNKYKTNILDHVIYLIYIIPKISTGS